MYLLCGHLYVESCFQALRRATTNNKFVGFSIVVTGLSDWTVEAFTRVRWTLMSNRDVFFLMYNVGGKRRWSSSPIVVSITRKAAITLLSDIRFPVFLSLALSRWGLNRQKPYHSRYFTGGGTSCAPQVIKPSQWSCPY